MSYELSPPPPPLRALGGVLGAAQQVWAGWAGLGGVGRGCLGRFGGNRLGGLGGGGVWTLPPAPRITRDNLAPFPRISLSSA